MGEKESAMKKEKTKVFVTGASGCLGASLVKRLAKEGYEVHALIFPGTSHPYLDEVKIKKFGGDVLDRESLRKAMKGCSYAYHVAGIVSYLKKDFEKMVKVHAEGTRNVLALASELGMKKVVCTSSCAVIGLPKTPEDAMDESAVWDEKYNKIGYMYSKMLAEKEVLKAHEKGLNVVMVNPTSFFGQGDINMNEGELIKNIKKGRLKFALPGGNSVVSVDDTVEGHLLAMKKGKSGQRYILSKEFLPFIDVFNTIAGVVNAKKVKVVLPRLSFYLLYPAAFLVEAASNAFNLGIKLTPSVVNFSFHFRYYKSDKARKELGWDPKQSFKESVEKAVEFYEKYNLI